MQAMRPERPTAAESIPRGERAADAAWRIALAAAGSADRLAEADQFAAFGLDANAELHALPAGHPDALIAWRPGIGWEPVLPAGDPRHGLLDLYLPICSATTVKPITVGHLGQSLDGFIATHTGESQFVTGRENILHLHRMRALCDAVVVGAGTVAADNPQLTTRHVAGPSPVRVIFDPSRGLTQDYRVFSDDSAPTLYVCARSLVSAGDTHFGLATIVPLDGADGVTVVELLRVLRERGWSRIFVEGGGVTVSAFLEANLLDRLQMAIAPLIIGDGRPAIRLPPPATLRDCHRPQYRVFRMGGDVLFDCELTTRGRVSDDQGPDTPSVTRVI
jgi:diaminohydroxyphosphoribosylaminopyrimidine deaminase/5-amino-6-(5-phosphoribosylamino)uracil reductase